jgi:NTE family protein
METHLQIGLALSGGGVRGLAHIGVIKVLEREKIPIHLVTGTSMGGFIGASYAIGLAPAEMEAEALRLSNPRQLLPLIDRGRSRRGFFQGNRLNDYLARRLGERTFDQLRLPLALVAVDLNAGKKVILREGLVLDAVRASIALPGLLSPVRRGDQLLVDGGILDNLPADAARRMGADVVIAVDVSTGEEAVELLNQRRLIPEGLFELINVLWRALALMRQEANRRSLEEGRPEVVICPDIPAGVTVITGLTRAQEIIAAGERATEEMLPKLEEILNPG